MVSRPIQGKQQASEDAGDVQRLVKQLVDQATDLYQSPGPEQLETDDQEVILDQEVNGVRCLLVRSHPHPKTDRAHVTLSPREQEIARMCRRRTSKQNNSSRARDQFMDRLHSYATHICKAECPITGCDGCPAAGRANHRRASSP